MKLKPCPFCGVSPRRLLKDTDDAAIEHKLNCYMKNIGIGWKAEWIHEESTLAWNRRAKVGKGGKGKEEA